jgi:hypothetical protein
MKTTDFNQQTSSHKLNENLYKKFGVKVDFNKYSREQLEDARNKIRTEIHQLEAKSNFNDLLTNETYQKNKQLVGLLNTRIKEMLGESIAVMERKLSGVGNKKKVAEKFDPLKHVKNPTQGEKDAAKDVKRGSYADRAAMLRSAEADGRLKDQKVKEGEKTEGNAFGAAVRKAKSDGIQKGEKVKVGGKEYAVKEGDKQTMSRAAKGHEKYGKEGMAALAKAGKEGKDLDKIRNKYDKYDEAVEEGFPTVADAKARAEKEKTTGKFDKKEIKPGVTQYTRKSNTFTDGGDDSDVKKAKKSAKVKEGNLPGNQEKIDADHDGKIEKSDLAKLRAGKKKMKESQHRKNVKLVNESIRRLIREDEEGKAKSITAGTDMVNDFTSWMTRVGQYQTKSMIELADAIRANFGQEQAETFKGAVAPALETALNTLTQAREQLSNAVAVLAGESSPMDTMGADMGSDMGGAEAGMDSMNAGNEEVPMDDEFGAADAAAGGAEMAGREMRESRKLFAAKLNEAHSIIARLSK